MTAPSSPRCLVVGGGVVGLAVALALRRRQAEVVVLERSPSCGQGASAAAAGMLAVGAEAPDRGPFLDLCRASLRLWPGWARELSELSGVDPELQSEGLLRVSGSEQGVERLEAQRLRHLDEGVPVSHLLDAAELRQLVPGLGDGALAGLDYPEDGHVHTHRLVEALVGACRALGVQLRTRAEVEDLQLTGKGARARLGDGEELSGDVLLVCAGAWSSRLLPKRPQFTVEPVRGQIVALDPGAAVLPRIVFSDDGYLLQKRSGLVLAGATEERVGDRPWPTADVVARLIEMAAGLLPALAKARFARAWAGLRPYAPEGLLAGRVSSGSALLVATGHFRNGVLLAPVTGELMARAVMEGKDPAELEPFRPSRPAAAAR